MWVIVEENRQKGKKGWGKSREREREMPMYIISIVMSVKLYEQVLVLIDDNHTSNEQSLIKNMSGLPAFMWMALNEFWSW